jgi:hypothetical protein
MKKASYVLTAALATAFAMPVLAQSAPQSVYVESSAPGQVSVKDELQLQGTITALDKQKRIAVIKGGAGNEITVTLGDEVKNIDQLVVGDMVTLNYGRALALELRKAPKNKADKRPAMREDIVAGGAAAPGTKPAGAVQQNIHFLADVIKVNKKEQTITVRGVKHTAEIKVNDPAQLKNIQVGDQVEGVYSEALAISVTPQAKK